MVPDACWAATWPQAQTNSMTLLQWQHLLGLVQIPHLTIAQTNVSTYASSHRPEALRIQWPALCRQHTAHLDQTRCW